MTLAENILKVLGPRPYVENIPSWEYLDDEDLVLATDSLDIAEANDVVIGPVKRVGSAFLKAVFKRNPISIIRGILTGEIKDMMNTLTVTDRLNLLSPTAINATRGNPDLGYRYYFRYGQGIVFY